MSSRDAFDDGDEEPLDILDGRQSPTAAAVQRGVCRMMVHMGYVPLTELSLRTGRRVDVVGLNTKGQILVVEIKSSIADFRSDSKWEEYLDHCDQFYFAVPLDFPTEILPGDQGLILADRYGGEVIRPAELAPLAAARRKAVTLTFARAAARRTLVLGDDFEAVGDA